MSLPLRFLTIKMPDLQNLGIQCEDSKAVQDLFILFVRTIKK